MPGEKPRDIYESITDDELKAQLDALKKQLEDMNRVLEQRQGKENSQPQGTVDESGDLDLNIDNMHLYMWGGKEKLDKNGVLDVIKSLKEPHKSEIYGFVKNNDVSGLQKYLNAKIDSGDIDKINLESILVQKGIWLREGHLFEDGKFGPQTLEAIKFLASSIEGGNNGNEGEDDKSGNGDNGNKDKPNEGEDKRYKIEKLGNKKIKVKSISSISDLPTEYKWGDPENYDESNEDTYPTVYSIIVNGKNYRFYSNGRCETPEGMKNTKDVVEKLKNGKSGSESSEYHGELPNGYAKTVKSRINRLFNNSLPNLGGSETVYTEVVGNKLFLKSTRINWGNGGFFGTPVTEIDLKKCLDSDGNFKDEYIKNELIPNGIKELREKKKAIIACDKIRKGKKYSKNDIFGNTSLNSIDETLVDNYFRHFSNNKLEFNDDSINDTSFDIDGDKANVRLRFDDSLGDEDWNRWDKNPDLIFQGSEIVNDKFELDETKLKEKLRQIILKIIKRTGFK